MIPINEYVNTLIKSRRHEIIISESLNKKESEIIIKSLNQKYVKDILKKYYSIILKYKELSSHKFNQTDKSFYFENNGIYDPEISLCLDCFENYAYRKNLSTKDALEAIERYKKDLISFHSEMSAALKPLNLHVKFIGEEGEDIENLYNLLKYYISKHNTIPSNSIECYVYPDRKIIEMLKPSESDIKENDKKKYLSLYDNFVNFIKNPHKLSGNFWAGHISDICKIIDISSTKLNELVSKNIKSLGVYKSFREKDEFSLYLTKTIGDYYIIDSFSDCDYIFYSIKNKKLYWVNYEHGECNLFYNNFPYNSKEFEDILYDNDEELKAVRLLFKQYDTQKKYNLF